ncbi:putative Kinesin heavy chain [Blattamonas nauphoetae]|uniref:Kinesin heavy chain n=1 Tax=Blattamonas nauphoetae TaxID=2049346 RepID=A0ABQ9Y3G3_9EUKA|nr:putative Kinesin heavy chain [Blattamonas nauphoetae]
MATSSGGGDVKVVCRFRPLNNLEKSKKGTVCINIDDNHQSCTVQIPEGKKDFTFDYVFPFHVTQAEVYDVTARQVIQDVMNGINGTILAYGQTSSGKTFTMMGPDDFDEVHSGIIPRMINHIFDEVKKAGRDYNFIIQASYAEIYQERIRDLLDSSKTNLEVRENKERGIYIDQITWRDCHTPQDFLDMLALGDANRKVASTGMNERSSRSHTVFMVKVIQVNALTESKKTGLMYLVDLAGSEKIAHTGAEGQQLEEAKKINLSLSALGNVINALTDPSSKHIPYRDSKLTRVLQETFGGNAKTVLVICSSGSSTNALETYSTLQFGKRAKQVKNKVKINQERSVGELKILLAKAEAEINSLRSHIKILESTISIMKSGGTVDMSQLVLMGGDSEGGDSAASQLDEMRNKLAELEKVEMELRESTMRNEALEMQLRNVEEEADTAEDELQQVRAELEKVKKEKDSSAGPKVKKEMNTLKQRVAELEEEKEKLTYNLNASETKRKGMEDKLSQLIGVDISQTEVASDSSTVAGLDELIKSNKKALMGMSGFIDIGSQTQESTVFLNPLFDRNSANAAEIRAKITENSHIDRSKDENFISSFFRLIQEPHRNGADSNLKSYSSPASLVQLSSNLDDFSSSFDSAPKLLCANLCWIDEDGREIESPKGAEVFCNKCKAPFCRDCYEAMHARGAMHKHTCVDLVFAGDSQIQRMCEFLTSDDGRGWGDDEVKVEVEVKEEVVADAQNDQDDGDQPELCVDDVKKKSGGRKEERKKRLARREKNAMPLALTVPPFMENEEMHHHDLEGRWLAWEMQFELQKIVEEENNAKIAVIVGEKEAEQRKNEELARENANLNENLNNEKTKRTEDNAAFTSQIATLSGEISAHLESLRKAEADKVKLQNEHELAILDKNKEIETNNEEHQNAVQTLERQFNEKKEELEREIENTKRKLAESEETNNQNQSTYNENLKRKEEELGVLTATVAKLTVNLKDKENELSSTIERNNESVANLIAEQKEKVEKMEKKNAESRDEEERKLNEYRKEKELQLNSVQNELEEEREVKRKLEKNVKDLEESLKSTQTAKDESTAQFEAAISELKEQNQKDRQSHEESVQSLIVQHEEEKARLAADASALLQKTEMELNEKYRKKEQELEEVRKEMGEKEEESERKVNGMKEEDRKKQKEIEELKEKMFVKESEWTKKEREFGEKVEKLEEDLQEQGKKMIELSEKLKSSLHENNLQKEQYEVQLAEESEKFALERAHLEAKLSEQNEETQEIQETQNQVSSTLRKKEGELMLAVASNLRLTENLKAKDAELANTVEKNRAEMEKLIAEQKEKVEKLEKKFAERRDEEENKFVEYRKEKEHQLTSTQHELEEEREVKKKLEKNLKELEETIKSLQVSKDSAQSQSETTIAELKEQNKKIQQSHEEMIQSLLVQHEEEKAKAATKANEVLMKTEADLNEKYRKKEQELEEESERKVNGMKEEDRKKQKEIEELKEKMFVKESEWTKKEREFGEKVEKLEEDLQEQGKKMIELSEKLKSSLHENNLQKEQYEAQLSESNNQSASQKQTYESQLAAQSSALALLRSDSEKKEEELRSTISSREQSIRELRDQIVRNDEEAQKRHRKQTERINEIEREIVEWKHRMEQASTTIATLEADMERKTSELANRNNENQEMMKQNAMLIQTQNNLTDTLNNVSSQLDQTTAKFNSERNTRIEHEKTISSLSKQTSTQQFTITQLTEQLTFIQASLQTATKAKEDIEKMWKDLQASVQRQLRLAEKKEQEWILRMRMESKAKIEQEKKMDVLRLQKQQVEDRLKQDKIKYESEIEKYENDLCEQCNRVIQLEMNLQSANENTRILSESKQASGNLTLTKRIGQLERSLQTLSSTNVDILKINGAIRNEKETLQKQLDNSEQRMGELEERIVRMKKELEALKTKYEDTEQSTDDFAPLKKLLHQRVFASQNAYVPPTLSRSQPIPLSTSLTKTESTLRRQRSFVSQNHITSIKSIPTPPQSMSVKGSAPAPPPSLGNT